MDKLKLMSEVLMTMRKKENVMGNTNICVMKAEQKVVDINMDFEWNLSTDHKKVKVSTMVDCKEKNFKHESITEYAGEDLCKKIHGKVMKHMLKKGVRIKDKLTFMAFVFDAWHNVKLEQREDQGYIYTLDFNDIDDEFKKLICEKIRGHCEGEQCKLPELHSIVNLEGKTETYISSTKELEKKVAKLYGTCKDEHGKTREFSVCMSVNYMWS